MICRWEGNRRSGITLAMRYRLQRSNCLGDQGPGNEDKQPAYTEMECGTLTFYQYDTKYRYRKFETTHQTQHIDTLKHH